LTLFRPNDDDHKCIKEELERKKLAEAEEAKERSEHLRIFEGQSHKIRYSEPWFDSPTGPKDKNKNKFKDREEKSKPEIATYKYSKLGIHESVIIGGPPTQEEDYEEKGQDACLEYLRSKMRAADPALKESFTNKAEFQMSGVQEQEYFIDEDSKETGLTEEEYNFLQDDIAFQIAEANRIYGYGGYGWVDGFGNHYRYPETLKVLKEEQPSPESWDCYEDKPKNHKRKSRKISPEEVAIARGIIKIRPEIQSKEEKI
jgi:hypothetical protein